MGEKEVDRNNKNRKREGKLSMSEQLLIVIVHHLEGSKISNTIINMQ